MTTISTLFATAMQHHQAGRLALAEPLYRQILQLDPAHADAHHCLGIIAHQTGRHAEAVQSIRQAVALNPAVAPYHYNLGLAHEALGQLPEAVSDYQAALRLQPDYADAHNNLANILLRQGHLEAAVTYYQHALRLSPNDADVHFNLGNTYDRLSRRDAAARHWQLALRCRPDFPQAHNNLGTTALRDWKLDEAAASFREALRLRPDYAGAHANLAHVLHHQGQADESMTHCQEALRIRPDLPEALLTMGSLVQSNGQLDEAMTWYEKALRHRPGYAEAHFNRALVWLLRGEFSLGWPEHEWRWKRSESVPRSFPKPLWDGSALPAKTILLHAEQGFGDTLQFIRYAPLAKQRGGTVIVECQPSLFRLLQGVSGIDRLVPQGESLPAFDVHSPMLSLPGIFQTTLATIPAPVPYLHADADLVEQWRRHFEPLEGFKVGIVWQGKQSYRYDLWRSIPLAQFERLAEIQNVRLVSLQKGLAADQLRSVPILLNVLDVSSQIHDFADTAAAIQNLDLVISCDTVVAHLGGALGTPVWVALPFMPDWRWMLQREDSPWYPTVRLFRQSRTGDWDEVFERIARELMNKTLAKKSGAKKW